VIDHHVENNLHWRIARVRGFDEIKQVLFGPKVGIDIQIVVDVVTVIGVRISRTPPRARSTCCQGPICNPDFS